MLKDLAHADHATLEDLLLHLHTQITLRSKIFYCTCTRRSRYARRPSLALTHAYHAMLKDLAHADHATLEDLLLHLHTQITLR